MNILFNSSGIPLLMQSTYIFGETTGTPQNEMKDRARILSPYDLSNVSYIDIDGVKIRPWGRRERFPAEGGRRDRKHQCAQYRIEVSPEPDTWSGYLSLYGERLR